MKLTEEEKIDNELNKFDNKLTEYEWWEWIKSWLDTEHITDIYENWDLATKKETIKDLKEIIKNRNNKTFVIIDFFSNPSTMWNLASNGEGNTLTFSSKEKALKYAEKNLQKDYYKIIEVD